MIRPPRQVLRDRSGVTSMEYAVLGAAFVLAATVGIAQVIAPSLNAVFNSLVTILG